MFVGYLEKFRKFGSLTLQTRCQWSVYALFTIIKTSRVMCGERLREFHVHQAMTLSNNSSSFTPSTLFKISKAIFKNNNSNRELVNVQECLWCGHIMNSYFYLIKLIFGFMTVCFNSLSCWLVKFTHCNWPSLLTQTADTFGNCS